MTWKATGSTALEMTSKSKEWDGDAAAERVFKWAGGQKFDARKAKRAFFAYDDADPHLRTNYKLPFADVVGGELKAVPRAIYAVAQVLEGARTPLDLPKTVQTDVRKKVEKYYHKLHEDPPW
jgi:hypothetical protein